MPKDINGFLETANIAKLLDQTDLDQIGQRVHEDYEMDKESRSEWEERNKNNMKLATQVLEPKNTPWPGASNIKYPLLSTACVQFAARAYPNLVSGRGLAKCKVVGDDVGGIKAGKGVRVQEHMNYQLLEEMVEWESEMDRLLTALPVEGCEFKKSYFDPVLGRNLSLLVRPERLILPYKAESLEKSPRATEQIYWTRNEAIEFMRGGLWLDIENEVMQAPPPDEEKGGSKPDEDAPHLFLEQHRFLDLDGDGYQEPYIVTIHEQSKKVVRIRARFKAEDVKFANSKGKVMRINPRMFYTKYYFMPSLDGSVYEMGFGDLLGPINETINTTINQLLDAGTLANMQGGFVGKEALGKNAGPLKFTPGEWKPVNFRGDDIRKALVPLQFKGPDATLFNLLGLMVESGEKLATVTDPLLGEAPPANTPVGTTLALIEQGMKVFTAIYKRIHRSFGEELKKLFRLNRLYLNPQMYFTVLDNKKAVAQQDYDESQIDIVPVSDPNEVTDVLKMTRAQVLQSMGPALDQGKVIDYALQAANIPDYEEFKRQKPPDPPLEIQIKAKEVAVKEAHLQIDAAVAEAEMVEIRSRAALNIAKAGGVDVKNSVDKQKNLLEHMDRQAELRVEAAVEREKIRADKEKAAKEKANAKASKQSSS